MDYADRILELRKSRGLTQKQLADNTGLSEVGIQSYERRYRKPAHDALLALADYFHVSTDYLLGRTDNPKLHVFEDYPKLSDRDFIDKLVYFTRLDHAERLREAEQAGIKIENPDIEYSDLLLRRYHRELLSQLIAAGVKL